jgi:hypothetical protein
MSLATDLDEVTEVLLTDGWHYVQEQSFMLYTYEYVWQRGRHQTSLLKLRLRECTVV